MFGKLWWQKLSVAASHQLSSQSKILAHTFSSIQSGCRYPQYGHVMSSFSPVYHFQSPVAVSRTRPIWNLFMTTSVSWWCSLERITVVLRSAMSASVLMIARLSPNDSHTARDSCQSKSWLSELIAWKRMSRGYFCKRNEFSLFTYYFICG